jgi:DNA polymerase III epsilon subunit-like protein
MNIAFDLETTGIDPFSDVPVSYAFVQYDGEYYIDYVNPGRDIPEGVIEIHHITNAMTDLAPSLALSMNLVIARLNNYWAHGDTIVGMNVSYDLTMVHSLSKRLDLPELQVGKVLDILVIDRHFDKWRKGSRKLQNLADYYQVELVDAHSALGDCKATLDILDRMYLKYPELKSLFGTYDTNILRMWYRFWLKDYNHYLLESNQPLVPIGRYSWPIHTTHGIEKTND